MYMYRILPASYRYNTFEVLVLFCCLIGFDVFMAKNNECFCVLLLLNFVTCMEGQDQQFGRSCTLLVCMCESTSDQCVFVLAVVHALL